MKAPKNQFLVIALLIALGFAARLLPHPANFAPIGAIALFGAIYLPKRYAIIAPLAGLFLSDLAIGFYTWQTMISVYASFILMGVIGLLVRKQKSFFTVVGGTLAGSILFFLITNLAVWLFDGMYPMTLAGLAQCYVMALPFFKYTVLGDMTYVAALVGGFEVVTRLAWKQQTVSKTK